MFNCHVHVVRVYMINYIEYFDLSSPMIDVCDWDGIECNLRQNGMSNVMDF
jgi:hypothetical protein